MRPHRRGLALAIGTAVLLTVAATPVGAAGPEYKNFWVQPFSEVETTCTGDLVEITGTIRHHVVFVNDGNGGFHGNGIFVVNASGVSEDGTRYVASSVNQLSQYIAPGDGVAAVTAPFTFRLISTDGSPNLYVQDEFHLTINANGAVVVSRSDLSVVCR